MRENKTVQVKVRLTATQKEELENYCAAHNLNISEALRLAITELLNGGKNNG